ncbi:hypothetical protein HZ993_11825 [Rhodoferax sp. AJA081-3]|uniref:hypothetical protein n=1 Tax=Rhodoferax sp. AJA081-3 TaxID=2752316 RepID=UPI001AE0863A|nr:hypothetical protein [Rhodoferax sp. AJA081-3]QTN30401.1 hypothetical protein HZ993_11825 [Rhodoferax sp. AJA081-3]
MAPLVQHYAALAQSATNSEPPPEESDSTALLADLDELQSLLARSDLKALDVHARVQAAGLAAGAKGFAELDQAVRDFDFARGAVLCDHLLAALRNRSAFG